MNTHPFPLPSGDAEAWAAAFDAWCAARRWFVRSGRPNRARRALRRAGVPATPRPR